MALTRSPAQWEVHRCSWCGEREKGVWVPVPPYTKDRFGFVMDAEQEVFMGWACLENSGLTRAERIADVCARDPQTVTRRARA